MDVPTTVALLDDPSAVQTDVGTPNSSHTDPTQSIVPLIRPLWSHVVEAGLEYVRLAFDLSSSVPPLRLGRTDKSGKLKLFNLNTTKKSFLEAASLTLLRSERSREPPSLDDCISTGQTWTDTLLQGQGRRRLVLIAPGNTSTARLAAWQARIAAYQPTTTCPHLECILLLIHTNLTTADPLPAAATPVLRLHHTTLSLPLHARYLSVSAAHARQGLQQLACMHNNAQPLALHPPTGPPVMAIRHLGRDVACPRAPWRTSTAVDDDDTPSPLAPITTLTTLYQATTWPDAEVTVAACYALTLSIAAAVTSRQLIKELRKAEVSLKLYHDGNNVFYSLRLDLNGDLALRSVLLLLWNCATTN
jgi:hypothetical protein